ncbi:MAG TPA: CDP-alcohol phosphatidyltransferase family protein [Thermomicrobiales bacterium]|nr:CDP-alcohol phosphatidyltransferase family protein [Thermomicrobiales bacterium]
MAPEGGVAAGRLVALALAAPTAALVGRDLGRCGAVRYLAGFAAATAAQEAFLRAVVRRVGPARASPADLLTLGRAGCAAVLAGLVAAGVRDRAGPAGRLGWLAAVAGATVTDWLDGPLARRAGATPLGAVLDIEADSWLTLWCAVAAARWGDLPGWGALPPLLRYGRALLDLAAGRPPARGRPGWNRATGVAQMALFLAALAPPRARPPRRVVVGAAGLVAAARCAAQLTPRGPSPGRDSLERTP